MASHGHGGHHYDNTVSSLSQIKSLCACVCVWGFALDFAFLLCFGVRMEHSHFGLNLYLISEQVWTWESQELP